MTVACGEMLSLSTPIEKRLILYIAQILALIRIVPKIIYLTYLLFGIGIPRKVDVRRLPNFNQISG